LNKSPICTNSARPPRQAFVHQTSAAQDLDQGLVRTVQISDHHKLANRSAHANKLPEGTLSFVPNDVPSAFSGRASPEPWFHSPQVRHFALPAEQLQASSLSCSST
jgi:hypothetical protein